MKYALLFILFAALATACTQQTSSTAPQTITAKQVMLTADDGVKISATYWDRGTEKKLILLHMLGRDSNDWNNFAENVPYTVIAIDLRGHGDSDGDLSAFSDPDFNKMILDVKSARAFITKDDVNKDQPSKIIIIGASIGANVALNYADSYSADGLVLLSPSHDYRGVDTRVAITRYKGHLLIVTSKNDEQSFNPSIQMHNNSPSDKKQLKIYDNAGHGTNMFAKTDLNDIILKFIEEI